MLYFWKWGLHHPSDHGSHAYACHAGWTIFISTLLLWVQKSLKNQVTCLPRYHVPRHLNSQWNAEVNWPPHAVHARVKGMPWWTGDWNGEQHKHPERSWRRPGVEPLDDRSVHHILLKTTWLEHNCFSCFYFPSEFRLSLIQLSLFKNMYSF